MRLGRLAPVPFLESTNAAEHTVNAIIGRRVSHDGVASSISKIIFTVDLILATIDV